MSTTNNNYPKTGDEIRKAFLDFYSKKSHKIIPSSSLIPDDPTVLLTIAGMLPFKSVFLGIKEKPSNRATSSQKCIRTNDIENVGVTARHHTFFEMLGNFSFGDYFKQDAIKWAWELVTEVYKLNSENIVISVFKKDDESKRIWQENIGINPKKIIRLDEKDNFWSSGPTGPCGPCSELYYDFYPERGTDNINLEDDDRFIEFYNLVFMQYNRNAKGELTDLESKNIDTGMGLERMAQIIQKKPNNYETDLIFPIISEASSLASIDYSSSDSNSKASLKILGDHTRAVIHLISDGVIASNLGRGYILRRLLRRMIRHGKLLGIKDQFISKLALVGIQIMQDIYPDLKNNLQRIVDEINTEELRFLDTLDRGEKLLNEIISSGIKELSGSQAFELYDTYGFPLELTTEILDEKDIKVDLRGFEQEMNAQKRRAKAASQVIDLTLKGTLERDIELFKKTNFIGYESLNINASIIGIFVNSISVTTAIKGQYVQIILDQTSFYAESGGQVGDVGLIIADDIEISIEKVIKKKNVFLHYGLILRGDIQLNQSVKTIVNKTKRVQASSNHTATHLLQSALKKIVDDNVSQRGSLVSFNKLRFDFNSPYPISQNQIIEIEELVNHWILENHPIEVKTMSKNDALKAGALAMFGEKYGEIVRVVDVPGVSMELCGGTHVNKTSELGCFKIVSELGISSGIRRIEALSGQSVLSFLSENILVINKLNDLLKSNSNQLFDRVNSLQNELLAKNKELKKINSELGYLKYSSLIEHKENISEYSIIVRQLDGLDGNMMQSAGLDLVSRLGANSAVIIGGIPDNLNKKLLFVVSFGANLVKKGLHAGKLVNDIAKVCSGGGGGKANIAQAGAKNVDKINEALIYAKEFLLNNMDD